MSYKQLILLAPCHGLEDFPLYHTGDDAASMIACWTALWHPALIHGAGKLPRIERCDYPPESVEQSLLVLPTPCEAEMDSDLPDRVARQNATLVRGQSRRPEILKQAFANWHDAPEVDAELVRDFLAFGFAFLQVELLTRQMRYASSIDQSRVESATLAAAKAAVENNVDACRDQLTGCFDALADERNHYYPVDVYLVDLTMLAPTSSTLGAALEKQLADTIPQNFLASGRTIEQLSSQHPTSDAALQAALVGERASVAGGEFDELELPLMTLDAARRQLRRGFASYQEHLGQLPAVFGRRRCGIYHGLSQLVRETNLRGALHVKFDEGRYPEPSQCKTQWEAGSDGSVHMYGRNPLDASLHETFLNLPSQLSDTMDSDHVATRAFIHWPGHVAPWYHDLRRAARYGDALGRFVTLQEYFSKTGDSGGHETFSFDEYKYPYLKQAVAREQDDPISCWTRYWHQQAEAMNSSGLRCLSTSLNHDLSTDTESWNDLVRRIDEQALDQGEASKAFDTINAPLIHSIQQSLCESDPRETTVLNPSSFARRLLVDTSALGPPCAGPSIYASARETDGRTLTLVDVPAMGFASVSGSEEGKEPPGPELAQELTLRNEFLQATIDPDTGTLRALKDYRSRTTRLSQQLALRIAVPKTGQPWIDRQTPATYTVMAADNVEITRNGRIQAEITSRGRLLDTSGEPLGEFVQRYLVTRGSRILQVEVELTPTAELLDDPWDSYYACRFAWADETAIVHCGVHMQTFETTRRRLEAPLFVDFETGKQHTTIFTGGLPYHRRIGPNRLDTPLIVRGEQQRTFRLGMGIDVPYKTRSAVDFMLPDTICLAGRGKTPSGWLFHVDAKNVIVTSWDSVDGTESNRTRVSLLETEGRPATVHLRGYRPFVAATIINVHGDVIRECKLEDGVAEFRMQAYECAEILIDDCDH